MAKQTKPWINYGDINFIEHGGCLVKEDDYEDCFHVMYLETDVNDYNGDYKIPMIVAKCYVDLSDWLKPDNKDRIEFNQYCGFDEDYIPYTLEEKMCYCADLVGHGLWSIENFQPDYPREAKLKERFIVGKTIAQRFLKEYDVPLRYRRTTMLDKRGA